MADKVKVTECVILIFSLYDSGLMNMLPGAPQVTRLSNPSCIENALQLESPEWQTNPCFVISCSANQTYRTGLIRYSIDPTPLTVILSPLYPESLYNTT